MQLFCFDRKNVVCWSCITPTIIGQHIENVIYKHLRYSVGLVNMYTWKRSNGKIHSEHVTFWTLLRCFKFLIHRITYVYICKQCLKIVIFFIWIPITILVFTIFNGSPNLQVEWVNFSLAQVSMKLTPYSTSTPKTKF